MKNKVIQNRNLFFIFLLWAFFSFSLLASLPCLGVAVQKKGTGQGLTSDEREISAQLEKITKEFFDHFPPSSTQCTIDERRFLASDFSVKNHNPSLLLRDVVRRMRSLSVVDIDRIACYEIALYLHNREFALSDGLPSLVRSVVTLKQVFTKEESVPYISITFTFRPPYEKDPTWALVQVQFL